MKSIFTDVINQGGYKLADMLSKIEMYHIKGKLTDEEANELIELARNKAGVSDSVDLLKMLVELDTRVKALEESKADEGNADKYPPFVEGKWYYNGGKCSENGVKYICIAPEGVVCVWSPSVYPAYWEVVI